MKIKYSFRVKNLKDGTSILVRANNCAHAMHLARRLTGWTNRKSDAEGYFGYEIRLEGST